MFGMERLLTRWQNDGAINDHLLYIINRTYCYMYHSNHSGIAETTSLQNYDSELFVAL